VPSSSFSISRLYPTTSAARMAASRRSTRPVCMALSLVRGILYRGAPPAHELTTLPQSRQPRLRLTALLQPVKTPVQGSPPHQEAQSRRRACFGQSEGHSLTRINSADAPDRHGAPTCAFRTPCSSPMSDAPAVLDAVYGAPSALKAADFGGSRVCFRWLRQWRPRWPLQSGSRARRPRRRACKLFRSSAQQKGFPVIKVLRGYFSTARGGLVSSTRSTFRTDASMAPIRA
jgi:hypothetical protein